MSTTAAKIEAGNSMQPDHSSANEIRHLKAKISWPRQIAEIIISTLKVHITIRLSLVCFCFQPRLCTRSSYKATQPVSRELGVIGIDRDIKQMPAQNHHTHDE